MKTVDVLLLVEHVDRELDVACLVKLMLETQHGLTVEVANFYTDAERLILFVRPQVVVTPFFYEAGDPVLKEYVAAWPDAAFFNMAWEQIFYGAQKAIKAPRDEMARSGVTHMAWGSEFRDYLRSHGVAVERIAVTGHPVYQLYRMPYRGYFANREALARRHGLDPAKKWLFVPENFRWAFIRDAAVPKLSRKGVAVDDVEAMRAYCRDSLKIVAGWLNELAASGELELVFRPRPATSLAAMRQFIRSSLGEVSPRFRIIKEESAREWVLASDHVMSSYSTTLIEAALAGKPVHVLAPLQIPTVLHYDWCDLVRHLRTREAFLDTAIEPAATSCGGEALKRWAEEHFLAAGDPIANIVRHLHHLATAERPRPAPIASATSTARKGLHSLLEGTGRILPPAIYHRLRQRISPQYMFNFETHEKDVFSAIDINRRIAAWRRVPGLARVSG